MTQQINLLHDFTDLPTADCTVALALQAKDPK